ncbi:MAG: ribonuclease HII [Kiritimatiellae bacterium]|nr:ribonuclease HII [Kiritimatiellia bacterium]
MLQYERQAWNHGCLQVAGVDEAGRGPLAGPVVAGAVLMSRAFLEKEWPGRLAGLTDSKQLSAARRAMFFALLTELPEVKVGVGCAGTDEIDRLNIRGATRVAMVRAVRQLACVPDHVLIDGLPVPDFPWPSTPIVKGDAKSLLIAGASVVAKVVRDRMMEELDARYPGYGFARHKGYGTREHLAALRSRGPTPIHRQSFAPVREPMTRSP